MPPKEKVTKEQIIQTAFEMTREWGFENVSARKLADALGCSTQPIFRVFENMDMLRKDIYNKTVDFFCHAMSIPVSPDYPVFLSMGLNYIDLAKKESHLFQFLSSSGSFTIDNLQSIIGAENHTFITEGIPGMEDVEAMKREEIFLMCWFFAHGIASLATHQRMELSQQEIKGLLIKAYQAFAKLNDLEV